MLSQHEQTAEAPHGGLEAQAGLPQSWRLASETIFTLKFQDRVTQIPSPPRRAVPGGLTHRHLLWVPTGYLHHPEGGVHLHLATGHELDDR